MLSLGASKPGIGGRAPRAPWICYCHDIGPRIKLVLKYNRVECVTVNMHDAQYQEVKPNANGTGNPSDVICKVGAHEKNGRTTRKMYKINFINNS